MAFTVETFLVQRNNGRIVVALFASKKRRARVLILELSPPLAEKLGAALKAALKD